ncbi:MAG: hypothetical protein KF764_08510 [Labilithrix sp.]|nr:hypothetical protein [Labilithrix sp.]
MDREPKSGEFVTCLMHCHGCRAVHEVALRAEACIRDELAVLPCPTCAAVGKMRLFPRCPPAPPPDSRRIDVHEPDDDKLLEHRARARRWS